MLHVSVVLPQSGFTATTFGRSFRTKRTLDVADRMLTCGFRSAYALRADRDAEWLGVVGAGSGPTDLSAGPQQ